jgi:hypothetical protein
MRHRLLVCLIPCLLAALACRRPAEPVASLAVQARQLELPHGRVASYELRWRPSTALPGGVTGPLVFVHLIDAQGNVVRTFDHQLVGRWTPGEEIRDRISLWHSAIGPVLPAGDYRLTVGLYDGKKTRFALAVEGGEELRRQEYVVAQVKVPEISAAAPAFAFSPQWLAPEAGGDRQSVARRWLSGDGTVEARGLPAPAKLWMLLRIPRAEPPLRLLLDPGATLPTVRVTAECGASYSASVAGEGFHQIDVPVRADAPCTVSFDTNYMVVEMGTGRKLSLGVEQLAWEPDSQSTPAPPGP